MTRRRTTLASGVEWIELTALALVCFAACSTDDREVGVLEGGAAGVSTGPDATPDAALPALNSGRVLATAGRSFDFGVVPPGQTATRVLVVGNIGDQTVTGVTAAVDGPFASEFSALPSAECLELPRRASCSVNLTFTPLATGARQARLVLSATDTSPVEVQLRGGTPIVSAETGGSPPARPPVSNSGGTNGAGTTSAETNGSLQLDADSLSFAPLEVQQVSPAVQVTLRNGASTSSGPLQVTSDAPLEFFVDTTCSAALAPGAECTLSVQFRPVTAGDRSGTVLVSDGVQQDTLFVSGAGQYRLTVVRAGAGVGTITAPGIDCGATCSALLGPDFVQVTATPSNGSDSLFGGWSGSPACTGLVRDCFLTLDQSLTLTATFRPQPNNLIFVTSERYPANLGGVAAFDSECNRLATAAGINNAAGNGFVAAISGAQSFWSRIPAAARGWVRMDGLPFGDQRAEMLTAPPDVYYTAHLEETGRAAPWFVIWTGTDANGDPGANCNDWTSIGADQTARTGHLHDLGGWLQSSVYTCDSPAIEGGLAFYCMGTTKTAPLVLPSFTGKRIWLTNTRYVVGSMTPDQACQAERPAGVSAARALVAFAGHSAAERLDPVAVYVRPDGQLVGTGVEVVSSTTSGVPWIAADGSRVVEGVWTGEFGSGLPTAADTCSDWTNPSGTGIIALSSSDILVGYTPVPCDAAARFYCIEP